MRTLQFLISVSVFALTARNAVSRASRISRYSGSECLGKELALGAPTVSPFKSRIPRVARLLSASNDSESGKFEGIHADDVKVEAGVPPRRQLLPEISPAVLPS